MSTTTGKDYSKTTTQELIDNYKDLIKKTFEVTDKDLLQEKIDSESDEESEDKYLTAIKKRRVALDEVDIMLEKIVKLEIRINGPGEDAPVTHTNPAKQRAKS